MDTVSQPRHNRPVAWLLALLLWLFALVGVGHRTEASLPVETGGITVSAGRSSRFDRQVAKAVQRRTGRRVDFPACGRRTRFLPTRRGEEACVVAFASGRCQVWAARGSGPRSVRPVRPARG